MILSNHQERTRFLRFAVVGIIGAVVDFGIFNFFSLVVHISPLISSVISFLCAVVSNFTWNRYWTYPDSRSKSVPMQVTQFIVVSLVGLAIRTPLFAWLEPNIINLLQNPFIPQPLQSIILGHNISLAITIVVVMFWNFFANRFWTYSDVK